MPEPVPNPNMRSRSGAAVIASGLLLAALALVVIYTSRPAFLSPLSLVIVAAIGLAALLLQVRLRPDAASPNTKKSTRGFLWLTGIGVAFSVGAVGGDVIRLKPGFTAAAALAAVLCFSISGISVLSTIRRRRS